MKQFNEATIATIIDSAHLVTYAAHEIALGIYNQLKQRSAEANATHDEDAALKSHCVANIATFVRDIACNSGAPDAKERLSDQLGSFNMHRSGYAIAGDVLKPVFQDVLGADATDHLCAAWGDVYWDLAAPLSQAA